MSRLAAKEIFGSAFKDASNDPLPAAGPPAGAPTAVHAEHAHSESDSDESGDEAMQRPSNPQLSQCLSSLRDMFELGDVDQLLLSIVVLGASGDLGKFVL